jgi:S1-C subfamily serine protease
MGQNPIVLCYDKERDLVTRMQEDSCRDEVVSEERAEEVRERRRLRLQRIIQRGKPKPLAPGARLASVGTGFFVAKSGHLLTNKHVVDKCKAVSVETPYGLRLPGKVIDTNPAFDLALVQVKYQPEHIAVFRVPMDLVKGERADLVGYPTQGITPIRPIHTQARLLQDHASPGDFSRFQIRGDVRGGNSGGPVLDRSGLTIGVIFAQLNSAAIFKKTGKVPDDIGIAVANPVAMEFLRRNGIDFKYVRHRPHLERGDVIDLARHFIARLGCWR